MTDIVERLRNWPHMTPIACVEAADEIERLRKENEQLKLALADDPDADICAENDSLTRDNERLREELATCRELREYERKKT